MSDATNGGGPLTLSINGKDVVFATLSFNDRIALIKKERDEERNNLKALLTETGQEIEQHFVELRAHDNEKPGGRAWSIFFNSDAGKLKILAKSIDKTLPGQGQTLVDQIDWDEDKVLNVTAYVARVQLLDPKTGKDMPNPLAPVPLQGYGT